MKKFWMVHGAINDGVLAKFDTYDEAERFAKRRANSVRECDFYILEAIAVAKEPIPPIEVVKLP